MSPDDELAQLEALLVDAPEPPPCRPIDLQQRTRDDARRRFELEARLRHQREADQLTMQQAKERRDKARYETNPWWE
ncbi:hypothetical protein [Ralstonia pseudosolanacearum]|uniref:hypothetical protein n=1 Tax=Ralstonia pseudosolanacearum TaxID=1310165 RepID=UPI0018D0DB17|nr:hypothetical protein [Ralstonia pseudosolanacearum]